MVNGYDINGGAQNFVEQFKGTELEGLGSRLDDIVEMYQDGDIDKDTATELIQDIKNEEETEQMASSMQTRSNFLKAADFLLKVL